MRNSFPTVGVVGAGELARMMVGPAAALGIDLLFLAEDENDPAAIIAHHVVGENRELETIREFAKKCDVLTFVTEDIPYSVIRTLEAEGVTIRPGSREFAAHSAKDYLSDIPKSNVIEISALVARSPHGQAAAWAITLVGRENDRSVWTETPAPGISAELANDAQKLALDVARECLLAGVMSVVMHVSGSEIFVNRVSMGLHENGNWTVEGSRTSQFEQHLRAILDLPLGDTSMSSDFAVVGNVFGGEKSDMYRPYLHLMARSPGLKFHQSRTEVLSGRKIGHVSAVGENILDLRECITHAVDYMSGEIDE